MSEQLNKAGLKTGWVGSTSLICKGLLPSWPSGCTVLASDPQERIHRIQAKAAVIWKMPPVLPRPFKGNYHPRVLLGKTFERLLTSSSVLIQNRFLVIGSGHQSFLNAIRLLELGSHQVVLLENSTFGNKNYEGWEVEKRRFESLGGKLVFGELLEVREVSQTLLESRVQDERGVRVLESDYVLVGDPFPDRLYYREWNPGSMLFELDHTEDENLAVAILKLIAGKIYRGVDPHLERGSVETTPPALNSAKKFLALDTQHQREPKKWEYNGKYIASKELVALKKFSGTPKFIQPQMKKASIECFEEISCRKCQDVCPEKAIQLQGRVDPSIPILVEDKCTACGLCLQVCPSSAPVMLQPRGENQNIRITLEWRSPEVFSKSELVELLSRKGDILGKGRVIQQERHWVELEIPEHLTWDVRNLRKIPDENPVIDHDFLALQKVEDQFENRMEILLDGEKRFVRQDLLVSQVLFECGKWRSRDALFCVDGSCQRCWTQVDGVKQLACQTKARKGIHISLNEAPENNKEILQRKESMACPCLELSWNQLQEHLAANPQTSLESLIRFFSLGGGQCRGALCIEPVEAWAKAKKIPALRDVQSTFPWSEWSIKNLRS